MTKLYDRLQTIRENAGKSVANSRHLALDTDAIDRTCAQIASFSHLPSALPTPLKQLPYEQQVGIVLLFGAINYCFVDPETNANYVYDDGTVRAERSSGVIQALIRSGLDWSDFYSLSRVEKAEWRSILQVDKPGTTLFDTEERIERLQSFASYLLEKVTQAGTFFRDYKNAVDTYELLIESGLFDDPFCKRIQVVLVWLSQIATDSSIPFDLHKEKLTAMADYRLPQVMCQLGIIQLRSESRELLKQKVTDVQFENDMRSAVIIVCSRIAAKTAKSEADIDSFFWTLSQELIAKGAMDFPAMRVATRSY